MANGMRLLTTGMVDLSSQTAHAQHDTRIHKPSTGIVDLPHNFHGP